MALDTAALRAGIAAVTARLETEHAMLTELDGRLGDGDLGITLLKAFRALDALAPTLPDDDLGKAFQAAAMAVNKASSSSFGTLFATALMAAAKVSLGKAGLPWSDVSGLVTGAMEAMAKRGRASLGDKTVLDSLAAVAAATNGVSDPAALLAAARRGADEALAACNGRIARIGRARIFAEKTIGMDDPGMMAFKVMVDGLPG